MTFTLATFASIAVGIYNRFIGWFNGYLYADLGIHELDEFMLALFA
jgi:hypothetical protein